MRNGILCCSKSGGLTLDLYVSSPCAMGIISKSDAHACSGGARGFLGKGRKGNGTVPYSTVRLIARSVLVRYEYQQQTTVLVPYRYSCTYNSVRYCTVAGGSNDEEYSTLCFSYECQNITSTSDSHQNRHIYTTRTVRVQSTWRHMSAGDAAYYFP